MGGLNRAEAAEYAGLLLAPFPAAQRRRQRPSFGELLDWLDGHPLSMRLTLPRLENSDPSGLLAALRGIAPLPTAEDVGAGQLSSLGACITYSFAHLTDPARRLLPAISLFTGIADEDVLMLFSAVEGVPGRFAGTSKEEWMAVLEDAARVGLLSPIGDGMYRIHPALPGYLAAGWQADDPDSYQEERQAAEQTLRAACAAFSQWLTRQIESGNAAVAYAVIGLQRRTLGAMLGRRPGPARVGRRREYRPGAGCVLGYPWPRRGSRRLDRPYPGRHRRPESGHTSRRDPCQEPLAVHHRSQGHPAERRRATGPGRANLPARPRLPAGSARNRMDPWKHRRHLPSARDDRPGPREAGRGRRLVPQISRHQKRTRQPS